MIGTTVCTLIGASLLSVAPPENLLSLPVWGAYSVVTGTVAMGLWVLAHECGHGAFSPNKKLQDAIGFIIHSIMLVPYYSWQRSHAIHHQYTNHMDLGETRAKPRFGLRATRRCLEKFGKSTGIKLWGTVQAFAHLVIGWPAYLLIGATGGPGRGMTNHFYPNPLTTPPQPKKELFPGNWKEKVYKSDIGIAAVVGGLILGLSNGFASADLYGGPRGLRLLGVSLTCHRTRMCTDGITALSAVRCTRSIVPTTSWIRSEPLISFITRLEVRTWHTISTVPFRITRPMLPRRL
jgi:omega-6 fatty acid desaturase (delta-12 desaturase)